jgi:hypothetical protein
MNPSYHYPPANPGLWTGQAISPQLMSPTFMYTRPGDPYNSPVYNYGAPVYQPPAYKPFYPLPPGWVTGQNFEKLVHSSNSCLRLAGKVFSMCATESLDRLYYGNVHGEVILLPLSNNTAQMPPCKVCIKPVNISDGQFDETVYEVQGLQLDYAGRVFVVNCGGLYVFDPLLKQNLSFIPDQKSSKEKFENYSDYLRRLQADHNKRYMYWIIGGGTMRVVDSYNCQLVYPDYEFNRNRGLFIKKWIVSPDGKLLFVLLGDRSDVADRFEVHNIPEKKKVQGFDIYLPSEDFNGDTFYDDFSVDFNSGKLVICGISPDEKEDENAIPPQCKELILRTYQFTSASAQEISVQKINDLQVNFYPKRINDVCFYTNEAPNPSGAGTLFISMVGGMNVQSNYLFMIRWSQQELKWKRHMVITNHHNVRQTGWEIRKNLVFTTAQDETLSINAFN